MATSTSETETTQKDRSFAIRKGWLIIFAFVIQLVAIYIVTNPSALVAKKTILGVSAVILLIGLLPNLRWWSFRVMLIGFVLNVIVMTANGGLMPLSPENAERVFSNERLVNIGIGDTLPYSKSVLLDVSQTRLEFLSDIIFVTVPVMNIYSIGDVLLGMGVVIFGLEALYRAHPPRRRTTRDTGDWWVRDAPMCAPRALPTIAREASSSSAASRSASDT